MNLHESIRRILREEDFIPLESLNLVIKDYEDGFDVYIMDKDEKIGEISFAKEDKPNQYTIVDATIDDEYKGNRIYPKTIIKLFKEKPNIIINSVFRSPDAEKAWKYLLSDLPSDIEKKIKHYKEENTTLYQLKLKNLQENIRRILRENKSNPINSIKRRLDVVDWLVDFSVREIQRQYNGICNTRTPENFVEIVVEKTCEGMYWDYFANIDDDSKEWGKMYKFMEEYINNNFGDKLREHFHIQCGD